MKPILFLFGLIFTLAMEGQTLRLTQSVAVPDVNGRIDHLSVDAPGQRLFVAALGNNTVEVVDLNAGKVVRSLRGFSEPQGLLFLPEFNRLYVANGGDGTVRVFDGTTFASIATLKFEDDADNLRYDATAKQVYVGYGSGALGIIDATKDTVVGSIPLTAHPESFQIEANGPRIFVNLPGSHTVAVIDRRHRQVIGHWPLGLVAANFPMALDEAGHRAFIACRTPARLLVFDTETGKELQKLELHGDCDDVFFDAKHHRVYASCGEGFLDVFARVGTGEYTPQTRVKTEPRGRTSFFDGTRIFVAVPRSGTTDAKLLGFEIMR